ncbi:MAG: lipoprotein release transporter permease [Deltaproteobacteria bacterium]|nr:lipoprotein release transporter permease [Deltaproteobacteria bacterium]
MRALQKKLVRDLWRLKAQTLTVTVIVAAGVASYIATLSTFRSLLASRDQYYQHAGLADMFARVQRAPDRVRTDLQRIPGVGEVEARVSDVLRVEVPGRAEPVLGQFMSAPRTSLNALFVRRGRAPERSDEVMVSEVFAEAHHLEPGATIAAIMSGRRTTLRVCGVGLSPEFLWVIEPSGLSFGNERFGVFWMEHDALATALGLQGAFNDLALALAPGARGPAVIDQVDRVLSPWGSYGAYERSKLRSDQLVSQEIDELRGSASLMPPVFLGVAAFLLGVVLSRLVQTQRTQIAALKALGYFNREVGLHYLLLALAMVVPGVILGIGLGAWAGRAFLGMYADYFRFPTLALQLDVDLVVTGALITLGAAAVGALGAVYRAVRLAPAEAMRPEAPRAFRPTIIERLGIHRLLPASARMVLRDLERQPVRILLSALGIALATTILVGAYGALDSIDTLVQRQFEEIQREDIAVGFARPVSPAVISSLDGLPGVLAAEGQRVVPVRIRGAHRTREAAFVVVPEGSTLRRRLDAEGRELGLPVSGVAMSRVLADLLDVAPGQQIDVEILEGGRTRRMLAVTAVIDDYFGLYVYAREPAFIRETGEPRLVSEVMLSVDRREMDALWRELMRFPAVTAFVRPEVERDTFRRQVAEVFRTFQIILAVFALAIAVAVVFNNARIAFVARARELATLRILGFTRGEVSRGLIAQQVVQLAIGIPIGLPLGGWLVSLMLSMPDVELYRLPVFVSPKTYATAAVAVFVAGLLCALWVARGVKRMDLVAVLKAAD